MFNLLQVTLIATDIKTSPRGPRGNKSMVGGGLARPKLSGQRTAKYVLLPNLNEKLFNGPSLGNHEMLSSAILYYLMLNILCQIRL